MTGKPNTYLDGTIVDSYITFYNPQTNEDVDPAVVIFAYQVATGPSTTPIIWDGANTTPAVNVIAKLGVGKYVCQIDTTSTGGIAPNLTPIYEKWTGQGTNQGPGDGYFLVQARAF
jgi:hypothetical protein